MTERDDIAIRRASDDDQAAILEVVSASLGWVPDGLHSRFFAWKHRMPPFGPSPAWVAISNGRVVGFRTFLRWQFETDDGTVNAVRAVDTATHPDFQGRGIFRRLTLHALDELHAESIAFAFNTPNERSRPGYLKMGWQVVGRVPIGLWLQDLRRLPRIIRARTPADRWSLRSRVGVSASVALEDAAAVTELVAATHEQPTALRTPRSIDYLRWRYGFDPLDYRALVAPGGVAAGMAVFRLRRRGPAVEAAVTEILGGTRATRWRLLREVVRRSGADYAVCARSHGAGAVPLPRQGPVLTWRAICADSPPMLEDWALSLGDIELL